MNHQQFAIALDESHQLVYRIYGPLNNYTQKIYIQASLHADELPGGLMIYYLEELLRQTPAEGILGNITIVPHANPIGAQQFLFNYHLGRNSLGGGGNFNRDHADFTNEVAKRVGDRLTPNPVQNKQIILNEYHNIISEKLANPTIKLDNAHRLHLFQLAISADIVLDCHCDSVAVPYLYTSHKNYPQLADLACFMGAEQIFLSNVSGGNSFDEAFSRPWWELADKFDGQYPITHQCQSTTLEYRGQGDVDGALARQDAQNIYNFLLHRGFIAGPKPAMPPLIHPATDLRAHIIVKSPSMGIVIYEKPIGVWVKKGDILAKIIDQINHNETAIESPIDGYFYARPNSNWVRRGDDIASIGGNVICKSDDEYLLAD